MKPEWTQDVLIVAIAIILILIGLTGCAPTERLVIL